MIQEIRAVPEISPGYPWTVSIDIFNNGTVTTGLLSAGCYLEPTSQLSAEAVHVGVATGDPLAPGRTVTLTMEGTIPADIPAGPLRLYVVLEDTSGRDLSRTGNIARLTDPVTVVDKPLPDEEELNTAIADLIITMSNKERQNEGLSPLTRDPDLDALAVTYSNRMVDEQFFAHTDPTGRDPSGRAEDAGYPTIKAIDGGRRIGIGENIAYIGTGMVAGRGYVDPTSADAIASAIMDGWMNSPGHRKNILDALADRTGTGVARSDDGYYYATQEFY